jgi:Spy/CpxP family protein refolding chaperone
MKKLLFIVLLAFATITVYAQDSANGQKTLEQRASDITGSMAKNLRLSPEQAKKLGEINLTSMKNAEEAKQKYKSDPKMIVIQMDIISQTRLSKIKDILSPQQFAQYQQRREEKMGVPKEAQSNPASRHEDSRYQERY